MQTQVDDSLSTTFAALADPTRRAILARLARGEATVKELAAPFNLSLPAVSKHLRVLQRAGLIEQGRQAQWRPCRLKPQPLRDVADWIGQYRRHWEESFERLDAYLREIQAAEPAGEPSAEPAGAPSAEPAGEPSAESDVEPPARPNGEAADPPDDSR